jgi:phosphatidylinositol alpha-1,6-mannosyltransferase
MLDDWFVKGRRAKARWFAQLAQICFRQQVDVVLCETVLPDGLSGWLLNQTLGIPYVVHAMGHDLAEASVNEWRRARLSGILESASKLIAISGFMGDVLIQQGADPDKVAVVVPGVNRMFLERDDGRALLIRDRFGLRGKKVIVTVSRLVERKGQDKVIEAMPGILDAVPDAVYLVVGDGPDRARLHSLASRLGVDNRVIFVGSVPYDEAPAFYSAADVFAMPNREMPGDFEGFGIVFLEANARGLPVIGGRSGGAQNAVADGFSGYLVNPTDVDDVARRLIELLRDPELAQRLGENGRSRVKAEFSWDRAAAEVRATVAETAADSPPRVHRKAWQTAFTLLRPDHKLLAANT